MKTDRGEAAPFGGDNRFSNLKVTLDQINGVLDRLKLPLLEPQELIPLKAA